MKRLDGKPLVWVSVAFWQGEEGHKMIDVLDEFGTDRVMDELRDWDYGDETTQSALVLGHAYAEIPVFAGTRVIHVTDWQVLTYNAGLGTFEYLRHTPVPEEDAIFYRVIS